MTMDVDLGNGDEGHAWHEAKEKGALRSPSAKDMLQHSGDRARRCVSAVLASAAELVRPGAALAARTVRWVLVLQLAGICLLSLGLLAVHLEIAHLRGTALTPIQGGSREIMARMCKESSMVKDVYSKMHNVVLIINTNYEDAARSTSGFLRAVYGRFFDTVVIISKESIPELGVEARGQAMWRDKWYWAYWHLPKIMADYPNADGYLWTNDDVALNYWRLSKGNLSKIWFTNDPSHPESRYFPFDKDAKAKWSDWAAEPECRGAARQAHHAIEVEYRKQFDRSVEPLTGTYPKRIVDLFYIPQRFAKAVSFDLIPVFREYKLWSEVAIPMMFYSLDHPKDFDHVLDDMVYSWGHWDQKKYFDPTEYWSANISAFHPWKLSRQAARNQLIMSFSSVDPCVLQLLPQAQLVE